MKVLFISPLTVQEERPKPLWAPLGLAFISALLREQGHAVSIFDRHVQLARIGLDPGAIDRALLRQVRDFKPDLIGLTTVSPLIHDTAHCVQLLRQAFSGPIVAGGHHATALPGLTLDRIPGLSGVVVREGELPMAALGRGDDPASVPGVWWRHPDGSTSQVPAVPNEALDHLPFPAMDLLDMAYYTAPTFNVFRGPYLSAACVLGSRGCSRRCAFCAESLTFGGGVRFHSPRYLVAWITKLLVDYPIDGIYFLDNDFLADKTWARAVCEAFLASAWPRRFHWAVQARADAIDSEMVGLMKRAGCRAVEIGVESASQHRLDALDKDATVAVNARAIALCRQAGMAVFAYMIIGLPQETVADLESALAWVKRTRPTSFGWRPLQIYPGTRMYETHGRRAFDALDWNEPNVTAYYRRTRLSSIDDETLERWLDRHYRPHEIWLRTLAAVRANSPRTLLDVALREPALVTDLARKLLGRFRVG